MPIHKIVAIVIKDNAFLMVRKKGKNIWTSLGGKPETGETEQQALIREIKEEVDCSAEIIKKLGDFTANAVFDQDTVVLSTYLVNLKGTPHIIDEELEELRYITKEEYPKMQFPESITKQIFPF